MSDSPPSRALAMQRRPTMSESSAWKNWLLSSVSEKILSWLRKRGIPSIRAVDAHFVNLVRVLAQILDVAEYMAAAVLADEVAQVCA